jgi:hypothetical protein
MHAVVEPYLGGPVAAVYSAIGYPNSKSEIGDRRVYTWDRPYTGIVVIERTNAGIGLTGGQTFMAETLSSRHPMTYQCIIRATVDPMNRVLAMDLAGEPPSCKPYVQQLRSPSRNGPPRPGVQLYAVR